MVFAVYMIVYELCKRPFDVLQPHILNGIWTSSATHVTVGSRLWGHQTYPKHKHCNVRCMNMTLRIKPVKLNKSIYFRVPNDIADLLGIDQMTEVTLTLEHSSDNSLLIYSIRKSPQEDLEHIYRRVKEPGEISAAPPRTETLLPQQ